MWRGSPLAKPPSRSTVGLGCAVLILTAVLTLQCPLDSLGGPFGHGVSSIIEERDLHSAGQYEPTFAGLSSVGSIPVASFPLAITYDNHDATLDVLVASNNLTMVRTSNDSVIRNVALPSTGYTNTPIAETYDGSSNLVFVTQQVSNLCTGCGGPATVAINGSTGRIAATNTSLQGIDAPDFLDCLGFDPHNGIVYACDYGPGKMILYNGTTDTIVGSIQVGSLPSSVAFDPANQELYVTNWGSDSVSVIDPAQGTVTGSIPVGSQPDGIAVDSATGFLFVANNASGNVTVIDGHSNTVVTSLPVGCSPDALTYDSADGDVYVANRCSNNLTAISGSTNTVAGAVPTGSAPDAVAYDSANQRVYVANAGSDNITVLATTYAVTFTESGLPSGTQWLVHLTGGASFSSATDTVALSEPDGAYPYTVATTNKEYAAVGGSFTVNGTAVARTVQFALVTYTVMFTETGLPSETNWSVVVAGVTHSTTGTMIVVPEPNGSYAFTVGNVSGHAVNRSSGTVTVNGTFTLEPLTFTSTSGGGTFLGLPLAEGYRVVAGIVIVVLAAAVAVALFARRRKGPATAVPPTTPSPPPTSPRNS